MTTRIAAPVIATVSLAVLMSGCAGAAAAGGGVRDDLRPAENAVAMGLARGHVIVRDDLSPTRLQNRITAQSVEQTVQAEVRAPWTAEARRELHSQPVTTGTNFSADALRELKGSRTVQIDIDDDLSPLGGPR
ncbi:hypothetical protein [Agromyces bauzanensis]